MYYTDEEIVNVKPTAEQLHRATYSHHCWELNYLRGLCHTPKSWAIACLQYEMLTGSPADW